MVMTVGELRDKLARYDDHVEVALEIATDDQKLHVIGKVEIFQYTNASIVILTDAGQMGS